MDIKAQFEQYKRFLARLVAERTIDVETAAGDVEMVSEMIARGDPDAELAVLLPAE